MAARVRRRREKMKECGQFENIDFRKPEILWPEHEAGEAGGESLPPRHKNIHENIPHAAPREQSDDSQPWRSHDAHTGYVHATHDERVTTQSHMCHACDIHVTEGTHVNSQESMCQRHDSSPINTWCEPGVPESIERSWHSIRDPQSIDMNALREEIKEMISATIKEKLCPDADSVTTVSQSILALDANAQYWSDLSNKATRHSCRALELQLKLAEEKVNTLLHEEAPEVALLEAAREARTIHFQLDQNMQLHEAGLMPEQQVRFSADTGRNVASPSRNYGVNPINESHIP
ncbi:hypothetical protein M422DRAFT_272782 [Sphaerobolus stellatus SS14]|uniref:Uncharacterized protein n=1 Tax=Sphaerobolus stellatus (strain SS14) TaxID=990650 RepID=A0A0C9UKZ0_SPHS4|nr:hypothetical protein M422DRAFT_272782 [Sphaerobolus stellatus SS14]